MLVSVFVAPIGEIGDNTGLGALCRRAVRRTPPNFTGAARSHFVQSIIMDSGMKTQSWMFAAALMAASSVQAEPAKKPAAGPSAPVAQRAESLTQDQIEQSHDVAALSRLAQLYSQQNDYERLSWVLKRVSELMPNSGEIKLQLALVYAKQNNKSGAYDTLMHMQMQGFGYDISKDPRFEPIHGNKVWDYLVANLNVNSKSFGEGKVAFELPKSDNLMNALAWDPKRKSLLIGSERDGSIHLLSEKGKLTDFIAAGSNPSLWGVDALGVDSAHDKLYVATSASSKFAKFSADNANKAALLEFDLSSGKFVKKYTPAQDIPRTFTDIAVSENGMAFVADGAHHEVFKLEGDALKPVVTNSKLTAISAIAISTNGRVLYIADYALGIFGFDLAKGEAFEPAYNVDQLVLGGITDMHFYDGTLIITEDGMVPKRVMRLGLSPDGRSIKSAMPLDVASQDFIALGDGAIAGDRLYFITNKQDSLYDRNGVLTDPTQAEGEAVFASNLRFAWGQSGAMAAPIPIKQGDPSMLKEGPGFHTTPPEQKTH
jgi:hypothetical protein